jgi:hypothetical protein
VVWATTRPRRSTPRVSLGEALLDPTRIYVKSLLSAIRETGAIKALAHITGGGFPENLPRVLPEGLAAEIDLGAMTVPPVFSWLARTGGVAPEEMLRTFNCGVGMIAVHAGSGCRPPYRRAGSGGRNRHAARPAFGRRPTMARRCLQGCAGAVSPNTETPVAVMISGRGSNMGALIAASLDEGLSGADRLGDFRQARSRRGSSTPANSESTALLSRAASLPARPNTRPR